MVSQCLEAAEALSKEGIAARVVSLSTIKPIDEELLVDCSLNTCGIVTAEEHSVIGGLGSAVAEVLSEKNPTRILRVGVQDKFGVSGSAPDILEYLGLKPGNIVKAAQQIMEHRGQKRAPVV
jgi:transketolase